MVGGTTIYQKQVIIELPYTIKKSLFHKSIKKSHNLINVRSQSKVCLNFVMELDVALLKFKVCLSSRSSTSASFQRYENI